MPHPALRRLGLRPAVVAAAASIALVFGAGHARGNPWPAPVAKALQQAQLPPDALTAVVVPVDGERPRLAVGAQQPVNPASIIKLATTLAALDLLGPNWSWRTPVWLNGRVTEAGVLEGSLHLRGTGDPKLVAERVWGLLQRVQQLGVREIRGDIVLDQSAFAPPTGGPGDFDGEPLRPYNVQPRALLINQRSVILNFVPDAARGVARVGLEPALDGLQVDATVPLAPGACQDWRAGLKATVTDLRRWRFEGRYPASCGERSWPVAYPEPADYDARLLRALWTGMGGRLTGEVREGPAPATPPDFEWSSPPLAEVVRDINKFSNNTMAQQLLLTLAQQFPTLQLDGPKPAGAPAGAPTGAPAAGVPRTAVGDAQARQVLRQWLERRLPAAEAKGDSLMIDNGSGLSREQRITPQALATLLQSAWRSPVMPELMASLPISGLDGTLRRTRAAPGRAHLKTGSLRDVAGVAGYVLGTSGRRYAVVAIAHHPQAQAARPAIDALVQWAIEDETPR